MHTSFVWHNIVLVFCIGLFWFIIQIQAYTTLCPRKNATSLGTVYDQDSVMEFGFYLRCIHPINPTSGVARIWSILVRERAQNHKKITCRMTRNNTVNKYVCRCNRTKFLSDCAALRWTEKLDCRKSSGERLVPQCPIAGDAKATNVEYYICGVSKKLREDN